MKYKLLTTEKFEKSFKKLDKSVQKIIKKWIDKNLLETTNPRIHGKELKGNRGGQWRYRIGNYRILALIEDDNLILIFIDIGHRKEIY